MAARPQPITVTRGDCTATYDPSARELGGVLLKVHRRQFDLGAVTDARDLLAVLQELIRRADGAPVGGGYV